MNPLHRPTFLWLGLSILLGLTALGALLGRAAVQVREYERSVTAKGLSEREYPADVVIWPISFSLASNDPADLYARIAADSERIVAFLVEAGAEPGEVSPSTPVITDRAAQVWGEPTGAGFRYIAQCAITVHSRRVEWVRQTMSGLTELGRQGIVLAGDPYQNRVQYLFERLNEVKPAMIEEATRNAREVALKFAQDSDSRLGKIRRASQGQFTIEDRDSNNPQIKRVRVVSTVEYYLSD